jgi:hypothetical protein
MMAACQRDVVEPSGSFTASDSQLWNQLQHAKRFDLASLTFAVRYTLLFVTWQIPADRTETASTYGDSALSPSSP